MISPVLFVCLNESVEDDRQRGSAWNVSFPASLNCARKHLHLPVHPALLFFPPTAKHAAAEMLYSVSCTTVARSSCMSDVEFEYIWHCNLSDLGFNEIRFVAPCVTFNSCSFNSVEKKVAFSQLIYMPARCEDFFILPSERSSYGSLAMQILLGSSWAVAAEFMCFCQAFAVLCMCQHRPRLTFWDGGNSPLCIFWSGCTCTPARKAHLHRITSESKNWKLWAVIRDRLVFRGLPLIF